MPGSLLRIYSDNALTVDFPQPFTSICFETYSPIAQYNSMIVELT
jgi:hypothetical protein